MNAAQKILMLVGGIFAAVGTFLTILFLFLFKPITSQIGFVFMPLIFVLLGAVLMFSVFLTISRARNIVKKGRKYTGKIYGYVENTAYTVNNSYTYNTRVRYFDERGYKRESVINTAFTKGSNDYPIGMTIDIYEYKGKWGFDKNSVRNEYIYREKELMENKPVAPNLLRMVGVRCPNCGASFQAATGYAGRCPFCDSYINT